MLLKYFNKKWAFLQNAFSILEMGYRTFMECDLIPLLITHSVSFLSSTDLAGALLTLPNESSCHLHEQGKAFI